MESRGSVRTQQEPSRRRGFLLAGLAAAATGALVSCRRSGEAYRRFFTPAEARTVDAICQQIIPADKDPGASEAGVVLFIDLQLTKRYKRHQAAYREGIAGVDVASRSRFGKPFVELSSEQQTEILVNAESNGSAFFSLIRAHTMQGFYGDPRHGGNRTGVSWRMLGLETPPVRGRLPYEKKAG
jgi:gluconate 2-dehydrogenase gamma chain